MGQLFLRRFVSSTPRLPAAPPEAPIEGTCDACGGHDVECVSHARGDDDRGMYDHREWRCRTCGTFTSEEDVFEP